MQECSRNRLKVAQALIMQLKPFGYVSPNTTKNH